MRQIAKTRIMTATAALVAVALIAAPAFAKEKSKKSTQMSAKSAAAAAQQMGSVPETTPAPKPGQHDSRPGPAWKTVGGTVKGIQGEVYIVEDYDGKETKMYVGQGTKHLRGNKKVGDTIRAEITHGGFANSIQ